jgi:DnaK suppressor protein
MLEIDQLIELEILAREEVGRLEAEIEGAREGTEAVAPDVAIGRLSRLDSMQIQEMAKDAQRRRESRLRMLREALERMDAGEYGRCGACGEWIDYARLESAPESVKCGNCAG